MSGLDAKPVDVRSDYVKGAEDERDRVTDLLQAVLEHYPWDARFSVFGLLWVQLDQLGWDEAMRRATRAGETP